MTKHVSYKGVAVDMDAIRRQNSHTVALGNARANARGDRLDELGRVAKTAEEIAREHHRGATELINTGIKGPLPEDVSMTPDSLQKRQTVQPKPTKRAVETELPSGDIVVEPGEPDDK